MKNALAVVVVAALAMCLPGRVRSQQEMRQALPDSVAAFVNGQPIPDRVLDQAIQQGASARGQAVALNKQGVLRALINTELLYQESQARNIKVSEAEIAMELEVLRMSPEAFPEMLSFAGEASEALSARIARKLAIEKLIAQVTGADPATPREIREFYDSHRDEFLRKAEVRLGHILLRTAVNAPPSAIEQQRRRIAELRQRIVAGEEFSAIARCCSDDKEAAQRGGDRGYFARDALPPEIAEAAFKLRDGEVSQIIQDASGYHLLRVIARLPQRLVPLQEAEAPIRAHLANAVKQQRMEKFLGELESRAKLVIVAQNQQQTADKTANKRSTP